MTIAKNFDKLQMPSAFVMHSSNSSKMTRKPMHKARSYFVIFILAAFTYLGITQMTYISYQHRQKTNKARLFSGGFRYFNSEKLNRTLELEETYNHSAETSKSEQQQQELKKNFSKQLKPNANATRSIWSCIQLEELMNLTNSINHSQIRYDGRILCAVEN